MLKAIDERLRLTLNYKVKADGTIGVHYSMMKSPENIRNVARRDCNANVPIVCRM